MKKFLICIFLMCLSRQSMMAQLTSLGWIEDSISAYHDYKIEYSNNKIYAAASRGLYQRELELSDEWVKLAFTDSAIVDFEVHGDTIVAISDSLLFISVDGGKTANSIFIDKIDPYRKNTHIIKTLRGVAVHPSNANKIHVTLKKGFAYTDDGGITWSRGDSLIWLDDMVYNPLDDKNLIAYHNNDVNIITYVSVDGGCNWEQTKGYDDYLRKIYSVVFHPIDKNKVILCGGGIYAISKDQGHSWMISGDPDIGTLPELYLYDIVYDLSNPDILYGASEMYYYQCQISIHRSMDGGFTWEVFYVIENESPMGVYDMCIVDSKLVIYTFHDREVYLLDVDEVASISPVTSEAALTPYYDLQGRPVAAPARGIYIKDGKKVVIR